VGTFHSVASDVLRRHISQLGAKQDGSYTIYDAEDSKSAVRAVFADKKERTGALFTAEEVAIFHDLITKAKNALKTSYRAETKDVMAALASEGVKMDPAVAKYLPDIWRSYAETLAEANALDYDDLLSFAVALLAKNERLAATLAARWPCVLCDEFQDTNQAQASGSTH